MLWRQTGVTVSFGKLFFAEALAQSSSTMNGSFGVQSSFCFPKKPLTESKKRKAEQWTRFPETAAAKPLVKNIHVPSAANEWVVMAQLVTAIVVKVMV